MTAREPEHDRPTTGPDRRAVLRGSGAAALGVSTLALPSAAAALSVAGARISEVTVYWSEMDTGGATGNRIGRLTFDGTSGSAVDQAWLTGLPDPRSLETDGTSLYYTSASSDSTQKGVWRVDPVTQTQTRLVAGDVTRCFVDDTHLYYAVWGSGIFRIAKDGSGSATTLLSGSSSYSDVHLVGDTLYFTEYSANRVSSIPKDGGSATTVATNITTASTLDSAGEVLYVGQGSERFVRRLSLSGASLGSISTSGYVNGVHVAAATLFVSTGNSATLTAFDLGGGSQRVFAEPFAVLSSIATSGVAVIV